MSKNRSLANQSNYCISQALRIGTSKRSVRKNGQSTLPYIFSNKTASKMRDFSNQLCSYLSQEHNIRFVRDITPEAVQAFVDSRQDKWSHQTKIEYQSRISKMETLWNRTFNLDLNIAEKINFHHEENPVKVRTGLLSEEDFKKISDYMIHHTRSNSRYIFEITHSIGCRVEEASYIRPEDVRLDDREVFLSNCKNGKVRYVPIKESDLPLWEVRLVPKSGLVFPK